MWQLSGNGKISERKSRDLPGGVGLEIAPSATAQAVSGVLLPPARGPAGCWDAPFGLA
jgi:hypothetical protein